MKTSKKELLERIRMMASDAMGMCGCLPPDECDAMRDNYRKTERLLAGLVRRTPLSSLEIPRGRCR